MLRVKVPTFSCIFRFVDYYICFYLYPISDILIIYFSTQIQEKYLEKFRKLPEYIYEDVPFVNITMFGAVGVGKSSFLNTADTALLNDPNRVSKKYVCGPMRTGHSKTKTVSVFFSSFTTKRVIS